MKFKSPNEIIDYFELELAENNVKHIRSALVHLLAESHPDKSGGEFESDNQKEQYCNIQEAINYLDSMSAQDNALVNINQITEIIKTVTDAVAPKKENDKASIEFQIKSELKREIKSSYNPIKISSGTIAGLSVGLISFSETLNKNPFFGPLLNIPFINDILFIILIIAIIWFIFTWIREKRDEQRKEWLFSEDGKLSVLIEVVRSAASSSHKEGKIIFSFRDFVEVIRGRRGMHLKNMIQIYVFTIRRILYGSSKIGVGTAEQIARYHLSDLESRNIIKKYDGKTLELLYKIDDELIHELPDRHYDRYYY